jgi:transcriptional regulator with XRE-family HTH domain
MTQERLADTVGVSAQAVSKWECAESIPDTALLISIADALGVSVDRLLGHNKLHDNEIYAAIMNLIRLEPEEMKAHKIREITWMTQKGWYLHTDQPVEPDISDTRKYSESSSISSDFGFTCISNRDELPFYTFFEEPVNGFGKVLKPDEKIQRIFEALSDEYAMKAFFYLYSLDPEFIFEKEVLAEHCGIPADRIDDVIEKLTRFCITGSDQTVNDQIRTLYSCEKHRYELIAILALMNEFAYHSKAFSLRKTLRTEPYFKME